MDLGNVFKDYRMYFYVISLLLTWLAFKVTGVIWRYIQTCRHVADIPKFYPQHWFWGYLYKVRNFDDYLLLYLEYVRNERPKWFCNWVLFLYPAINLTYPTTMREVLAAIDVPKNHGIGGPYRMIKGWIGDGLLVSGGKKWERNRRLLTPAFHFDILRGYVADFNTVADIFISRLRLFSQENESFDVCPLVSRATLDTMLRCTVSYEDDTVQDIQGKHPYVTSIHKLTELLARRSVNPLHFIDLIYNHTSDGREFKQLSEYVHTFSNDIIQKRKRELETDSSVSEKRHLDFLDTLLTARDENDTGLSDLEIRDEVDTFMFEGHDTTASAISWALYALAKYPTMQQKVRQEVQAVLKGKDAMSSEDLPWLSYTTCFIKESLRMHTPVPIATRKLSSHLQMYGKTLKPDQEIFLHFHLLHNNPDVWETPQDFQPERFLPENIKTKDPYSFIPFSAGQRNCIGQHFAMNEIKVIISKVVCKFDISIDPYRPAVLHPEVVMRAKDGIYLHFVER